ncbi:hypothetical protein F5879DRAFT_435600 [Lentinula edodes]|uniref:Uncharacterized protein n=1 Tax=Lentinula edodes TaxID=5353 RepID=A0A1Q3EA41_LENED|nr:hypothetical protein F5879DRAFT_435600 [Lentinula edodes]GAW04072.1 hypothetical protein LENED_005838 [Lentinula edodes]
MRLNLALFVVGLVSFAFALPLNTTQPEARVLVSPKPDLTSDHTKTNVATPTPSNSIVPNNHAVMLRVTVNLRIPISIHPLTTKIIDDCLQTFLQAQRFKNVHFSIMHVRSSPTNGKSYCFDFSYANKMYEGTMTIVRQTANWVVDSMHSNIHEVDGPHL